MDINEKDNNILRPMIMSALIPGLGQYMQGDEIRSGVYLGIELSGLYANSYYNNEGDQEVIQYKFFSEQYWTFEDWIINYDCWNPLENGDCDYNYSYLFSSINSNTGEETYIPIWQSSHHINFYINPAFDASKAVAEMNNGLLEIIIPKGDASSVNKISIKEI